jgi:hypothetical protein
MFARVGAITPSAHDPIPIVENDMRGERKEILNRWKLRQNRLGWVLNNMLFTSIKRTHDTDKPFLDAHDLIGIPQNVG